MSGRHRAPAPPFWAGLRRAVLWGTADVWAGLLLAWGTIRPSDPDAERR